METNEISMGTQPIPLGIRLPYRVLGVVFGLVALRTLFSAIWIGSLNFFMPSFLIAVAYAGFDGIMAYGFWKMRKWIVPLLGGVALIVVITDIANIAIGTQGINPVLIEFAILGILFLFVYFSRKFLNGDYKNIKALGLSLALIIFPQIIIFLLK